MKANNVDVYVLLKNRASFRSAEPMVQMISRIQGIHKAAMNPYVPSLMTVEYDPSSISSQVILTTIREQGYQASLTGM